MNIGTDADALHPVGLVKGRRIGSTDGCGKLEHARMSKKLANGVLWDARAVFALPGERLLNRIEMESEVEATSVAKGETVSTARQDENPRPRHRKKDCQGEGPLPGALAKVSRGHPSSGKEDKSNGEIECLGEIGESEKESQERKEPPAAARDANPQNQSGNDVGECRDPDVRTGVRLRKEEEGGGKEKRIAQHPPGNFRKDVASVPRRAEFLAMPKEGAEKELEANESEEHAREFNKMQEGRFPLGTGRKNPHAERQKPGKERAPVAIYGGVPVAAEIG